MTRKRPPHDLLWPATGVAAGVASLVMLVVYFTLHSTPPRSPAAASGPASPSRRRVDRPADHAGFSPAASRRRRTVFGQADDDEAFERLGQPQPGDWLASFAEPGQTFEEYLRRAIQHKDNSRHTLHLRVYRDLNAAQRRALPILREHLALFFDTRVVLQTGGRLPRLSYAPGREQYDAERLVEVLAERVPADSLGLMGLTGSDLFVQRLAFVFGLGSPDRRAGIYSLHRFGDQRAPLLRRGFKLSVHEMGHMFGLGHCVFYGCVMNGVNSLAESDRCPLHLCPVCLRKLQHAVGFDAATRYRALARFYAKHQLMTESAFVAARASPRPLGRRGAFSGTR